MKWQEALRLLGSGTPLMSAKQPEHRWVGRAHLGGLPPGGCTERGRVLAVSRDFLYSLPGSQSVHPNTKPTNTGNCGAGSVLK